MDNRIIVIDDDKNLCKLIEDFLRRRGCFVEWFKDAEAGLENIRNNEYDAAIIDVNMPAINGLKLCEILAVERPDLSVIIITAFGSMETAVSALRAGAFDFITKPLDLDLLEFSIKKALAHHELKEKIKVLDTKLKLFESFEEIIGESPSIKKVFSQTTKITKTKIPVLITGESGTGKELFAKAIHNRSKDKDFPFVAVNCSAIPKTLFESELFGFKKGSFTDAKEDHKGLILQADKGTLFLDEVGDFPLELQPKLLRAIEEKKVRPIGSDREIEFDARIISATNQSLEDLIDRQLFREDLYYRLNVIHLDIPPLRERGNDVLLLADYYIKIFAKNYDKDIKGFTKPVIKRMLEYPWQGNIRELKNAIERAVALTNFDNITLDDFPDKIRSYDYSAAGNTHVVYNELITLEEVQKRHIMHILSNSENNLSKAAQILGINRTTLYRKMEQYNISTD